MKKKLLLAMLCTAWLTSYSFADSNAVAGTGAVTASETVFVGGPYSHAGPAGDAGNSMATATFVGAFNANTVNFTGTSTSTSAPSWASEVRIGVTDPGVTGTHAWSSPGPAATYTTYNYFNTESMGGTFGPVGVAAAGDWNLEFYESFDDAGTDSESSNVFMTLQEVDVDTDSNGAFTLAGLSGAGSSDSSIGEFVYGGLFDTYSFAVTENGRLFSAFTSEDATGFVGSTVDTEIALYDSVGNLIAENDDGGPGGGLFSGLSNIAVNAGDYTLYVGSFNTVWDPTDPSLNAYGGGTGDYSLNASISAIPEPTSIVVLGMVGLVGLVRRRR